MRAFKPIICIVPSPTQEITGLSGWANFAPSTYVAPGPIVASVPETAAIMPSRSLRFRAHQFVAEPESPMTMQRSGRRRLSSLKTLIGFKGSAVCIPWFSRISHQRETWPSICSRQERSSLRRRYGMSALRVCLLSPITLISIG
jgi:hypothetical protein